MRLRAGSRYCSCVFEQLEGLYDDVVGALAHKAVGLLPAGLQVEPLDDVHRGTRFCLGANHLSGNKTTMRLCESLAPTHPPGAQNELLAPNMERVFTRNFPICNA